ncbi:GNVR domain-containing protein [Pseudomonas japonica]|uniref:LPS O-antigen chain length determinant protein, WzzB/FepE family n=1 Tax=Pseudomonas japonica TaxID=256466 RepID=A0A239HC69_9PSED|nr:GNVR domain-containing protein [Pseudomonas japonica]SNS79026.1 LPS O-antigen chain length determinant protein, WzzB/FepE family [Pseudomonas japonica]
MNIPVKSIDTSRQEVLEVKELISGLWDQRAVVLLFTALAVTASIAYVLWATPEYEVESYIRPVAQAELDEFNESGLYVLQPKDALIRVGSSMQSYDVRLSFFRANPQYLAPLQAAGQTLEEAFDKFNEKAFSLESIDPTKSKNLSDSLRFTVRYPQGIDGVGITKDFTNYVVTSEKERVTSGLKILIANRITQVEKNLESKKAGYEAEKDSKIATLLEKDQLKRQLLQDELKALRQQLQSRRQNRIKELDEAITIAKKLGIVKPTTPSTFSDESQARQSNMVRTEVNNQKIPLYFMGQSVLEAERSTLETRRSDDFTEPRIDEIQKELSLLASNREVELLKSRHNPELFLKEIADIRGELTRLQQLNTKFDNLELARVDKIAMEPQSPVKPKKALIVGFGLLFGFLLGLGVAVVRRSVLASQQSRH